MFAPLSAQRSRSGTPPAASRNSFPARVSGRKNEREKLGTSSRNDEKRGGEGVFIGFGRRPRGSGSLARGKVAGDVAAAVVGDEDIRICGG